MNYIGKIDSVIKPIVTANGVNVVAVKVNNRIGDIPTCSISVLPEDVRKFEDIDTEVTVSVQPGGTLFKGYPTGISCSNMNGSISAGVDLIHVARDLAETSSLVPGMVPGGTADIKTWLFLPEGLKANATSGKDIIFPVSTKPFGEAICEGITKFLEATNLSYVNGFSISEAGEKSKAISMIREIGSNSKETGNLAGATFLVERAVSGYCQGVLSRVGGSATMWDVLSEILGSFDCYLSCKPDGKVVIVPNFTGVSASGNSIESSIIQKFDRSAVSPRSPKECKIVGTKYAQNKAQSFLPGEMGSATSSLPGSRGTMVMSVPGWLDTAIWDSDTGEARQKLMDKYAEAVIMRHSNEQKTFNLMCPVCPGVFPGTSAKFQPASSIKAFDGGKVSSFDKTFDGYCYSVEHYLSTGSFCTTFMFKTALETDRYQKQGSHPLFEGAKMLEWT